MKMKNILGFGKRGLLIGMLVIVIVSWVNGSKEALPLTVWLTASFIYGASSEIFNCEKLNLLSSTIIHFLFSYVVTVSACAILNYAGSILLCAKNCLVFFIIIYAIIYITIYISEVIQTKKVNDKLKEKF